MVAHLLPKQRAAGSNPVSRSIRKQKPTDQSVGFVVSGGVYSLMKFDYQSR